MAKRLINYDEIDIDNCEGVVAALIGTYSHTRAPTKFDIDLANPDTQPTKHSIEAPPNLELKKLVSHL